MNLTPEMIKDARAIKTWVPGCSLVGKAERLADAVLKFDSDYDPDGRPLGVDEAFCESLGMKREQDGPYVRWSIKSSSGAEIKWWGDDVEIDCTQVAANMTRPQLRSLLESLRGPQ